MQYKFVPEQADYSDLASGRVFHSLAGHPAFPVRLASEILQRCLVLRTSNTPCVLYDPCCGAGYALSVLGYLHRERLSAVIGSDVDERAVTLAAQNLALLNPVGLDQRIAQLQHLFSEYGKESHQQALASAARMRERIASPWAVRAPRKLRGAGDRQEPLTTHTFRADAINADALAAGLQGQRVDVVFTDVPYGQHSTWQGAGADPVRTLLGGLLPLLSRDSVVAVASDKQQKVSHEQYQRLEHFQVGKRRIVILKPVEPRRGDPFRYV